MFTNEPERLLTTGEVAELFGVDRKTVPRWEQCGNLHARRTLGGHRRFLESEVYRLLWGPRDEEALGGGGLAIACEKGRSSGGLGLLQQPCVCCTTSSRFDVVGRREAPIV